MLDRSETLITVLHCLAAAKRLPMLQWGSICRLCFDFGSTRPVETPTFTISPINSHVKAASRL